MYTILYIQHTQLFKECTLLCPFNVHAFQRMYTIFLKMYSIMYIQWIKIFITAHGGHSTSINVYGVWGARIRVQVSKREFHTHVNLD